MTKNEVEFLIKNRIQTGSFQYIFVITRVLELELGAGPLEQSIFACAQTHI